MTKYEKKMKIVGEKLRKNTDKKKKKRKRS